MDTFRELLELSQQGKKGLTFYIGGQTVVGYVVRIADNGGAVEVRNQAMSRIVILLDRVDAVAMA